MTNVPIVVANARMSMEKYVDDVQCVPLCAMISDDIDQIIAVFNAIDTICNEDCNLQHSRGIEFA